MSHPVMMVRGRYETKEHSPLVWLGHGHDALARASVDTSTKEAALLLASRSI